MSERDFFGGLGLAVGATVALVLILASGGTTGDYHSGTTLYCYDCHTMHFSQTHEWGSGNAVNSTPKLDGNWLGTTTPTAYLLKAADANALCLACHDGQNFAPDVLGDNTGSHVRQAGALATGTDPYQDWKGHTLGSPDDPPGKGSSTYAGPLTCAKCHATHGNPGYRNLAPVVTYAHESLTSRTGTNDVSMKASPANFADKYGHDAVRFNSPGTPGYPAFCKNCHQSFHGTVGGTEIGGNVSTGQFRRHPAMGVNIGAISDGQHSSAPKYATASANRVHVMSGTTTEDYFAASLSTTNALTPSCMSCHKGHGNKNPFGLIFMGQSGAVSEEGTTTTAAAGLRNLCGQCHTQGA